MNSGKAGKGSPTDLERGAAQRSSSKSLMVLSVVV
jgi:hypothetical protein